jgi:hypothetical protein
MFCAPELVFGGTEGVWSHFHVLRSQTHFWRYRGHRVPFSCFARPESFSAIPTALGPVFMFCKPDFIFGSFEGVGSRFHVLRVRTHFRRYRGRRVPFSCFARPDSFTEVPRASGPIFMFSSPGLIFGGTEGVGSRFQVLRSRTHFRRYQGRPISFSCFPLPDMFLGVARVSGPVFTFRTPGLVFSGTEGVESLFRVLRSWTLFWWYRGRRFPFSCFALSNSFSVVPRASGPVFTLFAPGHVFSGNEGVRSRFHVLRSRTHFLRYRGRRVPFSCFPLPDSFSAVSRASGPVFMFCVPVLVFGGTKGVGSHFLDLRSMTRFRWYQRRRVPFSCFVRPASFSAVPRASCTVFLFCAPEIIFGGTEGVGSRFHVLRAQTHFRRYRRR